MNRLTATNRLNDGGRHIVENPQAADLDAPLISSIIPRRSVGSVTYSRASIASFTDHEGVIRQCISGEARFQGARRVQNGFPYSQELTNASWQKQELNVTLSSERVNGIPVYTLTDTAVNNTHYIRYSYSHIAGNKYMMSATVKAGTLSYVQLAPPGGISFEYANFDLSNGTITGGNTSQATITPVSGATGYYRISFYYTSLTTASQVTGVVMIDSPTAPRVQTYAGTGKTILATAIQIEDVTYQSVLLPAEYVSTNVLSSPFHGANVDGVKYFNTTIAGLPISPSILKGILMEPNRTNRFVRSEDFGTTWAIIGSTRSVNSAVAPSGELTADNLIPNNGVQQSNISQTVTTTASQYSFSVYVKSSGLQFIQLNAQATISNGYVNFDIVNGTVGTSSIWTGSIENVGNGWFRCTATTESAVLVATQTFNIYCVDSNSALRGATCTGDGVNGVYLWGAQLEIGATATSYILTVGSIVTRNVDYLSYGAGNILDVKGAVYCEIGVKLPGYTNLSGFIIDRGSNGRYLYANNSVTALNSYDGTNILLSNTGASYNGSVVKVAASWTGSTKSIYYGDTVPKTGSYVGSFGTGNINIGYSWNGTIRNVKVWKTPPTVAELTSITSQ